MKGDCLYWNNRNEKQKSHGLDTYLLHQEMKEILSVH